MGCWWSTTKDGQAATRDFARKLSKRTGLKEVVVTAWVYAECGPRTNPLGVSPAGRVAEYRSLGEGLNATVRTLNNGRYENVLRAARRNASPVDQLKAIASSPWATDPQYETKLLGSLASLEGVDEDVSTRDVITAGAAVLTGRAARGGSRALGKGKVGKVGKGVAGGAVAAGVLSATGWLDDLLRFVQEKAALTLAYVVLTLAAAVLFVLGLSRVSGVGPGALRPAPAATSQGGDIPF